MVHFKVAGITCSAWAPIIVSFATGALAGILGIGSGENNSADVYYTISFR